MKNRAQPETNHLGDEDLILLANGELPGGRGGAAEAHLESCSACREQLHEIRQALKDFAQLRRSQLDPQIPPLHVARRELRRRLAAEVAETKSLAHSLPFESSGLHLAVALAALVAVAAAVTFTSARRASPTQPIQSASAPDPRLTPGLAAPLSRAQACAAETDQQAVPVSREIALEVFRRYGIAAPTPGAYEVDYVIPPELGGRSDVRNLWPQPYDIQPWNAHAKDALEDHLLRSVCDGSITVEAAQLELSAGWIAAYQRHFGTAEPLVEHASFLRDEPWR